MFFLARGRAWPDAVFGWFANVLWFMKLDMFSMNDFNSNEKECVCQEDW